MSEDPAGPQARPRMKTKMGKARTVDDLGLPVRILIGEGCKIEPPVVVEIVAEAQADLFPDTPLACSCLSQENRRRCGLCAFDTLGMIVGDLRTLFRFKQNFVNRGKSASDRA